MAEDGDCGVTVITGVMFNDQFSSMPLLPVLVLVSYSFQTPGTHKAESAGFFMSTVMPSKLESWPVGRKVPVNGAVPAVIEVSAASSNVVLMNPSHWRRSPRTREPEYRPARSRPR